MPGDAFTQLPVVLSTVYSTGVRVYQAVSVTRSGAQAPLRVIDSPAKTDEPSRATEREVATLHIIVDPSN